jgi:serine/threonine protein kinase
LNEAAAPRNRAAARVRHAGVRRAAAGRRERSRWAAFSASFPAGIRAAGCRRAAQWPLHREQPDLDAPSINVLALPIGYELDGYRIERVLGAGGFGITYLAVETLLGRKVAIKEFLPTGIATRGTDGQSVRPITGENQDMYRWGIERFRQEAQTLVKFAHPNVVAIERYFEANGTAYLVMQYIEGKSLGTVLREFATIEAGEILELLLPLLDGLAHVHDAGFLHRDIKPDNIFISTEGRPILIDFGAARQALGQQSKSLTAIVSEGYAPYEQYEAHGNQGPWTDIYAVGAVMYRCMTGEKPLAAPSRVAAKFRGRPDPLPAIAAVAKGAYPKAMMAMAERALAVNEDDRPQTVADLLALLKDAAPEPAPPPSEAPTGMAPDRTLVAADIRPPPRVPQEGAAMPPAREPVATPRRRAAPALIAAGVGALFLAGASAAWIGGAFSPGIDEASTAAMRDAERRRADEAERARRAQEEERRRAEEEAKRKAAEDARKAEEDRMKAEEERRRKAEDDRRKAEEDAARRRADDERRKAEEAEQRRKAEDERKKADEEAAKRRAEEERKKAEEDRQRRADAERDAEEKRRVEEERARAARLKGLLDRAEAQLRQARAQMAQNRLPEARRSVDEAREAAAGALRVEPASAEAKKAAADADALGGELRARVAARIKELAEGAGRDIDAGRAAEAARKIAELERLDAGAAELAGLRDDLRALRARQEEAARRRREDEARRRAEAERARPAPAAPRPAQPAQPAQPNPPPARAPERQIPIPP